MMKIEEILMMQKEKVRRLRHDVKKHISNLEYVMEKEPDLRSDPSFRRYQEMLNTNLEWLKGGFYCDSTVMNLCFEQMKRYCDDKGITLDIALKRLNFSGWSQEDQLMFGTLLLNLLEVFGDSRPVAAVHFSGDNLLGQNILRISMKGGSEDGQNQCEVLGQSRDVRKDNDLLHDKTKIQILKERKLISNLEKDIQLVLSKYDGRVEHSDDGDHPGHVINWKDH